mmetsp:Transcript_59303/g.158775  ORF Transcript_59303/g.158775 Transcript_59303/m.158775 type:complete len:1002 (+) Transcript_59303:100-3105(+)
MASVAAEAAWNAHLIRLAQQADEDDEEEEEDEAALDPETWRKKHAELLELIEEITDEVKELLNELPSRRIPRVKKAASSELGSILFELADDDEALVALSVKEIKKIPQEAERRLTFAMGEVYKSCVDRVAEITSQAELCKQPLQVPLVRKALSALSPAVARAAEAALEDAWKDIRAAAQKTLKKVLSKLSPDSKPPSIQLPAEMDPDCQDELSELAGLINKSVLKASSILTVLEGPKPALDDARSQRSGRSQRSRRSMNSRLSRRSATGKVNTSDVAELVGVTAMSKNSFLDFPKTLYWEGEVVDDTARRRVRSEGTNMRLPPGLEPPESSAPAPAEEAEEEGTPRDEDRNPFAQAMQGLWKQRSAAAPQAAPAPTPAANPLLAGLAAQGPAPAAKGGGLQSALGGFFRSANDGERPVRSIQFAAAGSADPTPTKRAPDRSGPADAPQPWRSAGESVAASNPLLAAVAKSTAAPPPSSSAGLASALGNLPFRPVRRGASPERQEQPSALQTALASVDLSASATAGATNGPTSPAVSRPGSLGDGHSSERPPAATRAQGGSTDGSGGQQASAEDDNPKGTSCPVTCSTCCTDTHVIYPSDCGCLRSVNGAVCVAKTTGKLLIIMRDVDDDLVIDSPAADGRPMVVIGGQLGDQPAKIGSVKVRGSGSGIVRLENLRVDGAGRPGVTISGGATVQIGHSIVGSQNRCGVMAVGSASVHLLRCTIKNCGESGVTIADSVSLNCTSCMISENKVGHGVVLKSTGKCELTDNIISENGRNGIILYSSAMGEPVLLQGNQLVRNSAYGLALHGRVQAHWASGTIADNKMGPCQGKKAIIGNLGNIDGPKSEARQEPVPRQDPAPSQGNWSGYQTMPSHQHLPAPSPDHRGGAPDYGFGFYDHDAPPTQTRAGAPGAMHGAVQHSAPPMQHGVPPVQQHRHGGAVDYSGQGMFDPRVADMQRGGGHHQYGGGGGGMYGGGEPYHAMGGQAGAFHPSMQQRVGVSRVQP